MKIWAFPLVLLVFFLYACNEEKGHAPTGQELAKTYCSSCHIFPDPSLLTKSAWKERVLPPMGKLLGINYFWSTAISSKNQSLPLEKWQQIIQFYDSLAPDKMPGQNRPPIRNFTDLFVAKSIDVEKGKFPASSYVKIDPGNHFIYQGDACDSTFCVYDAHLRKMSSSKIHATLVDMDFSQDLHEPGDRSGILTDIGILSPTDRCVGKSDSFFITRKGALAYLAKIIDSLPRPVQTIPTTLGKNGKKAYVVCGFGNVNGALYLVKPDQEGRMEKEVLRALPGAIKAYVEDFNHDGLLDIMVLMAQAQEGIFLLTNKGNGEFETKELLRFPPIYGSSYFELDDFNGDGFKDILYTCGDNADYTRGILKNYHGVYIFLNDGKNNFTQKFFFPINGCYKAMARDFDGDGDLDIAAISFFPDEKNQPQESFVYLEQKKPFEFEAYTIPDFAKGHWLTMDAADVDGDGDIDIVLGSLVPPVNNQRNNWLQDSSHRASLLLLENKTK